MFRVSEFQAAATPVSCRDVARLIMQAMNYDCCQYFAGPDHTLHDFEELMTRLVERDDTQYSWRGTLVALADDGTLAGICTSYDGARLKELRKVFIAEAIRAFGIDHSGMPDETQAGELYIDSLAVKEQYRGQGVATMLLNATVERGRQLRLPSVGLLVDKGNPRAEKLYQRVGFRYKDDNEWGGHPMKHYVFELTEN